MKKKLTRFNKFSSFCFTLPIAILNIISAEKTIKATIAPNNEFPDLATDDAGLITITILKPIVPKHAMTRTV